MATFIMRGKYSVEAVKQISRERTAKGTQIVEKCGGKIASVYVTMGADDVLVIADFPGVREAIKASVGLTQALGIAFATVPAVTMDEFDTLVATKG